LIFSITAARTQILQIGANCPYFIVTGYIAHVLIFRNGLRRFLWRNCETNGVSLKCKIEASEIEFHLFGVPRWSTSPVRAAWLSSSGRARCSKLLSRHFDVYAAAVKGPSWALSLRYTCFIYVASFMQGKELQ
jgi:hypothetical protein